MLSSSFPRDLNPITKVLHLDLLKSDATTIRDSDTLSSIARFAHIKIKPQVIFNVIVSRILKNTPIIIHLEVLLRDSLLLLLRAYHLLSLPNFSLMLRISSNRSLLILVIPPTIMSVTSSNSFWFFDSAYCNHTTPNPTIFSTKHSAGHSSTIKI